MELIGYLGGLLLSFCALPELIRTVREKKCHISSSMLYMWLLGEVLVLIYVLPKQDLPLILNYLINTLIILVMGYYKLKEKK